MLKIINFFIYIIFFLILSFVLISKESVYFYIEEKLQKNGIYINEKKIEHDFNTVNIKDGQIYFKNISIFSFEEINLKTFLLVNKINIKNISVNDFLENFLINKTFKELEFSFNVLNQNKINGYLFLDKKYEFILTFDDKNITILFLNKEILETSLKNILINSKLTNEGIIYEYRYN